MTDRKSGSHRTRGRLLLRVAVLLLSCTAAAATVGDALDEIPLDESVRQLREQLRNLVESSGRRSGRYGVLALSLDTGDTLYDSGARDMLAPASNMKLLTTAAALHYLGPDFRYQTFLLADGPIEEGRLKGNLVLYGTGTRDSQTDSGESTSLKLLPTRSAEPGSTWSKATWSRWKLLQRSTTGGRMGSPRPERRVRRAQFGPLVRRERGHASGGTVGRGEEVDHPYDPQWCGLAYGGYSTHGRKPGASAR